MSTRRTLAIAVTLVVFSVIFQGCSQGHQPDSSSDEIRTDDSANGLAVACERAIERLDSLLAKHELDPQRTPGLLFEARELRKAATDLYLDGEYALALLFIDEAISIMGKSP